MSRAIIHATLCSMMKACANPNCSFGQDLQDSSKFANDKSTKSNLTAYCKVCLKMRHKEYQINRAKNDPERHRMMSYRAQIKYRYGLSWSEYETMLNDASWSCRICEAELDLDGPQATRPHVDHNHGSGNVRGILCAQCNRGLGQFKDDYKLLEAAIEYLTEETL